MHVCVHACSCVRLRMSLSARQAVRGEAGREGAAAGGTWRNVVEAAALAVGFSDGGGASQHQELHRGGWACLHVYVCCLAHAVSVACGHLWDMSCLDQQQGMWAYTCL